LEEWKEKSRDEKKGQRPSGKVTRIQLDASGERTGDLVKGRSRRKTDKKVTFLGVGYGYGCLRALMGKVERSHERKDHSA